MDRVIKLAISFCYWLAWRAARVVRKQLGVRLPPTCVFLTYHGVTKGQRRRFAEQMDEVLRHVQVIAAGTVVPLRDDAHYAAVTFDDAFRNFTENALPETTARGIPVTMFAPTGYFGETPGWLTGTGHEDSDETIMTEDELRGLPDAMVMIGSHSATHGDMCGMTEAEAMRELSESKSHLEMLLERPVRLFSFPYGEHNEKLIELSAAAGYDRVFTNVPLLALQSPDEFVSGRVGVSPDDWPLEFRLKLLGAYRWLPLAFALKRKLMNALSGLISLTRQTAS
jgi:peptidoglycan/xylan/chitin deacetylase (PgdA/CDA1 family)